MRYREWGEPDNPRVLVCVHGLARTGADFNRLARALSADYRVVCPDVVGRGESGWLPAPGVYGLPQYVSDMVSLIARLDVKEVDWLGTSMGGLIGIAIAGQAQAPVRRLVINDVGPRLEAEAISRIGDYVGRAPHFADLAAARAYVRAISAPFALSDEEQWNEAVDSVLRVEGEGWRLHYDPRIGDAFRATTPQIAAAGEAALWQLYDSIRAPTLLVRGEQSDLLTCATAAEMRARGPRPQVVEVAGVGHAPLFMDEAQIAFVRNFLLGE